MIYTFSTIESLVRTELGEFSTTAITAAEMLNTLNDAYKDVALKAFCVEVEDSVVTSVGNNLVSFSGYRVNYIELLDIDETIFTDTFDFDYTDTSSTVWDDDLTAFGDNNRSLIKILPTAVGYAKLNGTHPQYWFPWGKQIYIEPIPDRRYNLKLYIADYPSAALSQSTDIPSVIPKELRSCLVDYALYMLSMKLNRWQNVAYYYNRYIDNLVLRRNEYISKRTDGRYAHEIPNAVRIVSNGR